MGNMISYSKKISRAVPSYIGTPFYFFENFLLCSEGKDTSINVADDHLAFSIFFDYLLQAGKGLKDKSICSSIGQIIDELIKISV